MKHASVLWYTLLCMHYYYVYTRKHNKFQKWIKEVTSKIFRKNVMPLYTECFQNQILYFRKTYINILYVSSVILYCIQPAGAWWINFCQGRKQQNREEEIIATNVRQPVQETIGLSRVTRLSPLSQHYSTDKFQPYLN